MITILTFNLAFMVLVFFLQNLTILELMIVEVFLAGTLSYLPVMLIKRKEKRPILSFDTDWIIHPEIQYKEHYQQHKAKKKYTEIDV